MKKVVVLRDGEIETIKNALRAAAGSCWNAAEMSERDIEHDTFVESARVYETLLEELDSADDVEVDLS